jgi:hypothetical protein
MSINTDRIWISISVDMSPMSIKINTDISNIYQHEYVWIFINVY